MGDFVYHFSYDRASLLELYDLFLELYLQGKNLYILAGNHDWLWKSFVFEEGKKAFQLLQAFTTLPERKTSFPSDISQQEIHFITKPFLLEIEAKQICFLPYMLDIDLQEYPGIEQFQDDWYQEQIQTNNKNQILSAKLHLLIQYFKNQYPELTFIHHYYFDGIAFPGQKSKFSFRDVALSNQWLEDKQLKFISGHLHQAFYYQNYLCTGSIRASSPLEENQIKGFWKRTDTSFSFYETGINYYFSIDSGQLQSNSLFAGEIVPLHTENIKKHHELLEKKLQENLLSLPVDYHFREDLDLKSITLSLRVEELNYQKMDMFVVPALQHQLQDIKLKKQQANVDDLLEKLQKPDSAALKEWFWGRIDLLKRFLRKQYPDTYQEYEKILQDLKLV